MKKFFSELFNYVFYGYKEGKIVNKRQYIDCNGRIQMVVRPNLTIVTLSKEVHFLGKNRIRLKEVIVNTDSVKKFNIGDYYSAE